MSEIARLQEKLAEIPELETFVSLALDMRWSWNHSSDTLWEKIDSELWALTRNPWLVLQSTSSAKLKSLLEGKDFRAELERLKTRQTESRQSTTRFQTAHPKAKLTSVAYFSMELGLSEALPIHSGGSLTVLEMCRAAEPVEERGQFVYELTAPASRPAGDYTARLTARFDTVAVPLEEEFALWQR